MIAVLVGFICAVGLAQLAVFPHNLGLSRWVSAAWVHSIIAFFIALGLRFRCFSGAHWGVILTSLLPVPLAIAAGLLTGGTLEWSRIQPYEWGYLIATVSWIPVVEEIVFRAGIGSVICFLSGKKLGVPWGIYISALTFSFAHSWPTLGNIMRGHVGLPLGPLLLGVVCQWSYQRHRSLVPAILFHAACNSTVIIFKVINPDLFKELGLFYL